MEENLKLPDTSVTSTYPDVLGFGILLVVALAVSSGAKVIY